MIDIIKTAIVSIWAVIMVTIAPTANALIVLVIFAMVNAFVGYQSNYITKRERFSRTKFSRAFKQLAFYMLLVILIHLAFHLFGEYDKALFAVKIVSWIALWGYTVKILQNFLQISPNTRGVRLIYYILAVKFVPKLLDKVGIQISEEELKKNVNNDITVTTKTTITTNDDSQENPEGVEE